MPWTPEYVKLLRHKLDRAGFKDVSIVAADSFNDWSVADRMREDRALYDAIAAVGVHYPKSKSTPAAQALGKPLWSSEDGPWLSDWDSASPYSASLASTFNRNYIEGRMTKTVVCAALSAFPEVFFIPDTGIVTARWPWCGHYRVPPAVWVVAHTTQFAEPGWKYIDSACALLSAGGSVVALHNPNTGDWSVIIETLDAKSVQTMEVALGEGLKAGTVRVWQSTQAEQFIRQPDLALAVPASLRLVVETNALYSLTTTEGQQKGETSPPALSRLPLPYAEDFERYNVGSMPRYFCDLVGAFEGVKRADGKGQALRQVLDRRPTDWSPDWINHYPHTYLAETNLTDYSWSAEVMLEKPGWAGIIGRVSRFACLPVPMTGYFENLVGYSLVFNHNGVWHLRLGENVLAKGQLKLRACQCHALRLALKEAYNERFCAATCQDGRVGLGFPHPIVWLNLSVSVRRPLSPVFVCWRRAWTHSARRNLHQSGLWRTYPGTSRWSRSKVANKSRSQGV